ncbi:phosphotransferase [Nonomuraea sediminis]|uniref:phosphotransferase n=1 Tax=Nonomuraea sediminis TaxID=2835864 RepID=UPI001BDD460C|nr:phosphotransferase [Nonomuraea sediminis]
MRELLGGGSVALLAGSRDPNAKVTAVVMDGSRLRVVKVATTAEAAAVVLAEGRLLEELATRAPEAVRRTVPEVLGHGEVDGLPALITRGMPGTPMLADYHLWRHVARRRRVAADFTAAAAWLALLQSEPTGPARPVSLATQAVDRVSARYRAPTTLETALAELAATSLPRTISHGDYWLGNILVSRGRVTGVVDWEAGEIDGDPLRDVARFALSYALYLHRHTPPGRRVAGHRGLRAAGFGPGISHALLGAGWFPALVERFVAGALERLGAPGRLWRAVLLAGLADVVATADDPRFAQDHLGLLERLCEVTP